MLSIDKINGNTLRYNAIRKEMDAVRVAFKVHKVLSPDEKVPPTYQQIKCHMIFEVKMDFRQKSQICCRRPYDSDAHYAHYTHARMQAWYHMKVSELPLQWLPSMTLR